VGDKIVFYEVAGTKLPFEGHTSLTSDPLHPEEIYFVTNHVNNNTIEVSKSAQGSALTVKKAGSGNARKVVDVEADSNRVTTAPDTLKEIEKITVPATDQTFLFGNDWGIKTNPLHSEMVEGLQNQDRALEIDITALANVQNSDFTLVEVVTLDLSKTYEKATLAYSPLVLDATGDSLSLDLDLAGFLSANGKFELVESPTASRKQQPTPPRRPRRFRRSRFLLTCVSRSYLTRPS